MDFGSRLAYVRKEKGLNQEQLAEMLGITRQTVYKWEAGITYPDVDKLCDTAKKLGVTTRARGRFRDRACDRTEGLSYQRVQFVCEAYRTCYIYYTCGSRAAGHHVRF